MSRRIRTAGLLPAPSSAAAASAELARLDRELAATRSLEARRLLALERRRALVRFHELATREALARERRR